MAAKKPENMRFEEIVTALDSIINELESGKTPLDDALKQFERGIALARQGQKTLTDAEQRVEILLSQNTNDPLIPFEDPRNDK